jgi:hypothetical protein
MRSVTPEEHMGNLDLLSLLATQPRRAFEALAERPRFWFPLLLAMVVGLVTTLWYFKVVDLTWLLDESLRANARTAAMTEEQRAAALQRLTPTMIEVPGILAAVLAVPIVHLIGAVYYLLAGKVVNVQRSFRHWFALSTWSALPTLLGVIPAIVVLATSTNGQLDQSAIQPLSLNELFFHRHQADAGYSLLVSLSVLQPLAWLLAAIGVQQWSSRSWLFSWVYVLLPSVLIYGCWAWFALR